jgi:hypothetical protein
MKLYTREQMIEAFNYGKTLEGFDWIGDMIDSLEAIEPPSDEEIYDKAVFHDGSDYSLGEHNGFINGAKYVIDIIQGGNK